MSQLDQDGGKPFVLELGNGYERSFDKEDILMEGWGSPF
jgi:hypothetical protein